MSIAYKATDDNRRFGLKFVAVPLPPGFDFHAEEMNSDDSIAAYGYAITAVTPTDPDTGESESCFLVELQDLECTTIPIYQSVQTSD